MTEQERRIRVLRLKQAQARAAAAAKPQTNAIEQAGTGVNEGIANMLGLPVDAMTGVANMVLRAANRDPIQAPFGGAESIRGALSPFMSEAEPQGPVQRVAREVGQSVGAGAVAAPVAGVTSAGGLALNTVADAVSGLASGATGEFTDNPAIKTVAAILGGMGAVGVGHALRSGPQAPTMDDLRRTQSDAYAAVEASPATLTPQATADLQTRVAQRMQAENMDPYLHPKASRTTERIGEMDQPTIYQVEQRRRLAGRDVAGALDASERELGVQMKDEIDAFLGGLQPSQVQGASQQAIDDVVSALSTGRETTRRIKKADMIDNAVYRGENRAATSGTGGNEINAIRQNIRAILDDPKKRRGFSADEIAEMEKIVRGTVATNAGRWVGGLSPDRGALPLMGNLIAGSAAGATQNPLFLLPGVAGFIAKSVGEGVTQKQVERLAAMIRNGAPLPVKTMSEAEKRVVAALMASTGANAAAEQ